MHPVQDARLKDGSAHLHGFSETGEGTLQQNEQQRHADAWMIRTSCFSNEGCTCICLSAGACVWMKYGSFDMSLSMVYIYGVDGGSCTYVTAPPCRESIHKSHTSTYIQVHDLAPHPWIHLGPPRGPFVPRGLLAPSSSSLILDPLGLGQDRRLSRDQGGGKPWHHG